MNLENIVKWEKPVTEIMILLMWVMQNTEGNRDRQKVEKCLSMCMCEGVASAGYEIYFWGETNVLKCIAYVFEYTKHIKSYTLDDYVECTLELRKTLRNVFKKNKKKFIVYCLSKYFPPTWSEWYLFLYPASSCCISRETIENIVFSDYLQFSHISQTVTSQQ